MLGKFLDAHDVRHLEGAKVGDGIRVTKLAGHDFITLELSFKVTKESEGSAPE